MVATGDLVGSFRVIGPHPGGGWRAVAGRSRVWIQLGEPGAWRASATLGSQVAILDHPGVARIVDRGVLADHTPWIATELADGMPLSEIMTRRTLGIDETVELMRDVAAILVHLHARGLVHDAVQPHAITLRTGARPFNIQLANWTGLRAGDGSADIHALGVLAYRALTGRFPGLHVPELVPGVPGAISALIVRMLAADPAERPDAAAVLESSNPAHVARRVRWTPAPEELQPIAEAITLPRKRV